MTKTVALVVAAGRGTRMSGDVPKQYRMLAGAKRFAPDVVQLCFTPENRPGDPRGYIVMTPQTLLRHRLVWPLSHQYMAAIQGKLSVLNGLEHVAAQPCPGPRANS